ncbi:unnamed protein product [Caenorhabditis bovis]|uniref:Mitochondrial fission process protein 1 n=1 Tax=Caenorhabditis bovis TaxID=2654633 RepID=A0A8S1EDI2_9PELO|nr:unnamed protein product [Caenorhabditis bovis]
MERVFFLIEDVDKELTHKLYIRNVYQNACTWIEWSVHGFPWIFFSVLALIVAYGKEFDAEIQHGLLLLNLGLFFDLTLIAFLKFAFQRQRPMECKGQFLENSVDIYSFPSGHTSRAAMLLKILHAFHSTTAIVLFPLPFIVGISRVALGRHYISDVVAGAVFGYLEGVIICSIPKSMTDNAAFAATENDLFRDSPVRYLGYANEVGEAFRSMVRPLAVKFSYIVAFGYVTADAVDKGYKTYKNTSKNDEKKVTKVGISAADTLIWQTFASVLIPGFTINRFCHFSNLALTKVSKLPVATRKWTVTLLGLATIPFIIHPIDNFVEISMNKSIRRVYNDAK